MHSLCEPWRFQTMVKRGRRSEYLAQTIDFIQIELKAIPFALIRFPHIISCIINNESNSAPQRMHGKYSLLHRMPYLVDIESPPRRITHKRMTPLMINTNPFSIRIIASLILPYRESRVETVELPPLPAGAGSCSHHNWQLFDSVPVMNVIITFASASSFH